MDTHFKKVFTIKVTINKGQEIRGMISRSEIEQTIYSNFLFVYAEINSIFETFF